MKRRAALRNLGGLLLAAPTLTRFPAPLPGQEPALRIAHLTDVHLKAALGAPEKYARCLHHVQEQTPRVDLVLNGGDVVFDMNKENLSSIEAQWRLYHRTTESESSLKTHHCLGNHDIWWDDFSKGRTEYGKQYAQEQLGLRKPYYSFSESGWKFIVLDSVHRDIDDTWYIGKLGEEQFAWLASELKSTPPRTPVLILSHIPILTATLMIEDDVVNRWEMLGGEMHTDTARIIALFHAHPNVKLCLSGHIHLRDKVVYNDVTYLCNGAVSGAWWEGNQRETAPGYGLIDLYADGSFAERYVNY